MAGRGKKKTTGTATKMKRKAHINSGGSSRSATLMATKFVPQIATTTRASSRWRIGRVVERTERSSGIGEAAPNAKARIASSEDSAVIRSA